MSNQTELDLDARRELDAKAAREQYKELCSIVGYKVPLDGLITALQGRASIDVVAWDEQMGVPDGCSMNDFILQNHGARAVELARNLI